MRLLSIAYTPRNRKRHLQFKECHHRHCLFQLTYPPRNNIYFIVPSQCRSVLHWGRGSTPSAWQMGSRFAVTTIQLSALIECLARRVEYHTAPMETVRGQKTRETPWTQTDSPACLPILVAVTYTHHRWGGRGVTVMKNFEWVLWLGEHVGFWLSWPKIEPQLD